MSEIKALHSQCKMINAEAGLGVVEAEFWTTDTGSLQIVTRGQANTGMWVDWGDGNGERIEHAVTGTPIVTVYTYTLAGIKQLKFSGLLDQVTFFECTDSSFGGDIGLFSYFSGLSTGLRVRSSSISGDISGISSLVNLGDLYLYNTDVDGDVANLSAMTGMTNLRIHNTAIDGYTSGLSAMTSLTYLEIGATSITGDIGDLSTLASLTTLYAYDNNLTYSTTTLPAWNNCNIQIYSSGLDQSEVDNFLIDLAAAGGTNGTLGIGGANAARSSASDAAKATLLTNGWVVSVNE